MIFNRQPSQFLVSILASLERDDWQIRNGNDISHRTLFIDRVDGQIALAESGAVYVKKSDAYYSPDRTFELTGRERRALSRAMRAKLREIVASIAAKAPEGGQ